MLLAASDECGLLVNAAAAPVAPLARLQVARLLGLVRRLVREGGVEAELPPLLVVAARGSRVVRGRRRPPAGGAA